jgi:hypothetical protein
VSESRQTERVAPTGSDGHIRLPSVLPGERGWNDQVARQYAQHAQALWDEQTEDLRPLHRIWERNLLFLTDQHWHELTRSGWRPRPDTETWRQRPTYNFCKPFAVTTLAKVTKTRPTYQVVPASSEPRDMQAAQLGDEVLEAKWTELKAQRRYRNACAWTIATGNGFLLPFWNTYSGKIKRLEVEVECPVYEKDGVTPLLEDADGSGVLVPATEVVMVPCDENGEPMLGADGRPKPGAKAHVIDEGEVSFRVLSPFQVRVNPEATSDEDVRLFQVAEAMSLREIYERWPEEASRVNASDVANLMGTQSTLASVFDGVATEGATSSPRDERVKSLSRALVIHTYRDKCEKHPEGLHWVSAGDVLLEKPGPLPDGLFCLIHMTDVIVPGRYHASSRLESVVSINREYNELSARIAEHHRLHANPKIGVPKQAGIRKSRFTSEPGEIVEYTYPFEPKPIAVAQMPASVFAERDRLLADFERVSGMRAVSQGGTSNGVTAGIAIMQLQEADDADMGPFLASGEEAVAALASAFLILIKNNYNDERLYYAAGPGRRYMAKSFRASDLEGAVDVVPQSGSSRPGSEVARQAVLMELAGNVPQLFLDPETGQFDAARFARALQFGGLEAAYESEDIDAAEALREEESFRMMGGVEDVEPVVCQPWQNDMVHLRQHRRTLAGAEWKEWPVEGQQALLAHFMETQAKVQAAQMQAAMAAAGMMPGQQGPRPGQGAPMKGDVDMGMAADPLGAEADMLEADMVGANGGDILN